VGTDPPPTAHVEYYSKIIYVIHNFIRHRRGRNPVVATVVRRDRRTVNSET